MVHRFTSSLTCALFKVSFVEYECEMQTLTILGHDQSEASTETTLDCVSNHLEVQGTLLKIQSTGDGACDDLQCSRLQKSPATIKAYLTDFVPQGKVVCCRPTLPPGNELPLLAVGFPSKCYRISD